MKRIEGLVQLKTGDAVQGVISHRTFWFRHLRVERTTTNKIVVMDGKTGETTPADGIIWVPKSNVNFVQELTRVTA